MHIGRIRLGIRILLLLCAFYIAISVIIEAIFHFFFPTGYCSQHFIIGLFFLVSGVIFNYSMIYYRNTDQTRLLNVYMTGRMIKFFFTILFLFFSIYYFKPNKTAFALITLVNYFIFSALELYIYSLYNKRLIKHEKKQKEHR